jgi:NAD(P)-dependent dehydrogenase (short-subunit alcohol dehydrogenase family)
MLLSNKVVVVSGIGPGLGEAIAEAVTRQGARAVLVGRSADRLEATVARLRDAGAGAVAAVADVTDAAQCRRALDLAEQHFGPVDVLVNNAYHPGTYERIDSADLANWRAPLEVNLLGTLTMTQAALPSIRRAGGGSIVMINSMSMRRMMELFGAYAASKAALLAATQTLALELGPEGIRVNSVVPGYIWGPPLEGYLEAQAGELGTTAEALYDGIAAGIPLRRIPTSAEIAETVVFFASDLSRVVTGQTLDVNGGHFFA